MKNPGTPPIIGSTVTDVAVAAERARQRHLECLRELQASPFAAGVIATAELANATEVQVPHSLGRVPRFVATGIVRGAASAGRIDDLSQERSIDRTRYLVLKATGYGATITVDVAVM